MENKTNGGGFTVNVYSPGNMFANTITFEGTVNIGGNNLSEQFGYTDEQIAQAIEKICGDGKPLDIQKKWAAVYWYLRWQCNFPVKGSDFCERIKMLPFTKQLDPECNYDGFRKYVKLSFMEQDARNLNSVKPSRNDEEFFSECRRVVIALSQELGKAALPNIRKTI